MKRFGIIYLLVMSMLFLSSVAMAQKKEEAPKVSVKKEISNAKKVLKNGGNLEATENTLRTLLKDSNNVDNMKLWMTLFDVVKKQYEQLNEKLYLKQQSDTAKFFIHTLHMFDVLESMDSVDAKPNKKGVSAPKYRKSHASFLNRFRKNLFGGGGYFINKQNYNDAYKLFDAYIDCVFQPLFTGYPCDQKRMVEAAYWTVVCGYKLGRPEIVEKYANTALRDSTREFYVLQYMAEAYAMKKDTVNYGRVLEQGFEKYPGYAYFFPHLAVYYGHMGKHRKVIEICDVALFLDNTNITALLAKSSSLLYLGDFKQCVKLSDQVIEIDPSQVVAYMNAGLAYYNQAVPLAQKIKHTKEEKQQLTALYKRALPYLEKYKELKPDAKEVWSAPLYNIYLNLNMGKEFEDMENIINQK